MPKSDRYKHMPEPQLSPEAREAVHAQRDAAFADQISRQAQIDRAAETAAETAVQKAADKIVDEKRLTQIVHDAVMKGFSFEDSDERRRFIDVTKEKLICQSIVGIDSRLSSIEANLTWTVRIVLGAVILAVLGLIFVK